MNIEARFEELQNDLSVDDLKVLWAGSCVVLSLPNGRVATVLEAENAVRKIKRWCVKNVYRCSAVRDGRVWL